MDDIHSWYEVPNIAHFCSMFRTALHLPDLDIQELEECLLTSCTDEGSYRLVDLVCTLLNGCYSREDIDETNYKPYLVDILEVRLSEEAAYPPDVGVPTPPANPMGGDGADYLKLTLRQKVEVLDRLVHYRLAAEDITEKLKSFNGESLRVEPLGSDESGAIYWYFFGSRLYKEDAKPPESPTPTKKSRKRKREKKKKSKGRKRRKGGHVSESESEEDTEGEKKQPVDQLRDVDPARWHLIASTVEQWEEVVKSLKGSKHRGEKSLYRVFKDDFLPEIPTIIEQREKEMRKKLLEGPARVSGRLRKKRQEDDEQKKIMEELNAEEKAERLRLEAERKQQADIAKQLELAKAREERIRAKEDRSRRLELREQRTAMIEAGMELPPELAYGGRDSTSESDSSSEDSEPLFGERDLMNMGRVLERVKKHKDAWPFLEPVSESVAPDYFSIISQPMDLSTMESKVDRRAYETRQSFIDDLALMVSNCETYNGLDNEFSRMARSLDKAFQREVKRCYPTTVERERRNRNQRADPDSDEEYVVKSVSSSRRRGAGRGNRRGYRDDSSEDDEYDLKAVYAAKSNPRRLASTRARQQFVVPSSEEEEEETTSEEEDENSIQVAPRAPVPKRPRAGPAPNYTVDSSSSESSSSASSRASSPQQPNRHPNNGEDSAAASDATSTASRLAGANGTSSTSSVKANHRRPFPSSAGQRKVGNPGLRGMLPGASGSRQFPPWRSSGSVSASTSLGNVVVPRPAHPLAASAIGGLGAAPFTSQSAQSIRQTNASVDPMGLASPATSVSSPASVNSAQSGSSANQPGPANQPPPSYDAAVTSPLTPAQGQSSPLKLPSPLGSKAAENPYFKLRNGQVISQQQIDHLIEIKRRKIAETGLPETQVGSLASPGTVPYMESSQQHPLYNNVSHDNKPYGMAPGGVNGGIITPQARYAQPTATNMSSGSGMSQSQWGRPGVPSHVTLGAGGSHDGSGGIMPAGLGSPHGGVASGMKFESGLGTAPSQGIIRPQSTYPTSQWGQPNMAAQAPLYSPAAGTPSRQRYAFPNLMANVQTGSRGQGVEGSGAGMPEVMPGVVFDSMQPAQPRPFLSSYPAQHSKK